MKIIYITWGLAVIFIGGILYATLNNSKPISTEEREAEKLIDCYVEGKKVKATEKNCMELSKINSIVRETVQSQKKKGDQEPSDSNIQKTTRIPVLIKDKNVTVYCDPDSVQLIQDLMGEAAENREKIENDTAECFDQCTNKREKLYNGCKEIGENYGYGSGYDNCVDEAEEESDNCGTRCSENRKIEVVKYNSNEEFYNATINKHCATQY